MFEKPSPLTDVGRIVPEANTVFGGVLFGAVVIGGGRGLVLRCCVTFGALDTKGIIGSLVVAFVMGELVTASVVGVFVWFDEDFFAALFVLASAIKGIG